MPRDPLETSTALTSRSRSPAPVPGPDVSDLMVAAGLRPHERDALARCDPSAVSSPRPCDSLGVEVCRLRLRIERDVAAWQGLAPTGTHEDDPAPRGLAESIDSYRDLNARLRRLHDSYVDAGRLAEADIVALFQGDLLEAYQKLARVQTRRFRRPPSARPATPRERRSTPSASGKPKPAAALRRPASTRDPAATLGSPRAPREARRPRGRLALVLNILLGAMAVALGVALVTTEGPPPPRIETTLADYAGVMALVEVQAIGTLLYARVEPGWAARPAAPRLAQIEDVGTRAGALGFRNISFVDPSGEPVGEWSLDGGSMLIDLSD